MKTETLRVQNVVDATRLGAWLRSGEGIGWLAAGTIPNSLYRVPFVYLFLACVFWYSCSFFFVVFVCLCFFLLLSLEVGRCSSDLFLSSRPRIGLSTTYITGMVEARSVNVNKTTTTTLTFGHIFPVFSPLTEGCSGDLDMFRFSFRQTTTTTVAQFAKCCYRFSHSVICQPEKLRYAVVVNPVCGLLNYTYL